MSERQRRDRHLEAAQGYLLLGMSEHALIELDQIESPESQLYEYALFRAEALRELKRYHEAIEAYSRAYAVSPTDVGILMGLAWCYKRVDRLPDAISAMHEAYGAQSREPVILYNLACYYSLAGDKDQTLSWLARALRMDRKYYKLAETESDFDPIRQDPDFVELLRLAGNSPPPIDTCG